MEERLNELSCPFTWNVPEPQSREYLFQMLNHNENQSDFLINGYCIYIVECFERARNDEIEVAIRKSQECETELDEYYPTGLFSKTYQYIFKRASSAMYHILLSLQAHLYYRNNDIDIAEQKLNTVVSLESLNESNKAALHAIKSRFYQVYYVGQLGNLAISEAEQAVELDASVPLWHFLLGKSLARYRRNSSPYDPPADKEMEELKEAWSECKKPEIGVMLLQSYESLLRNSRGKKCDTIKQEILDIVNDIKKNAGNEWYVYWRCAHVCVRLPPGVLKKEEVSNIIDLAFEWSDKTHNTNKKHLWEVRATYFKFIEKNYEKALEFYTKAADEGEFTCVFEVLSINNRINKDENLLPIIDKYLDVYKSYMKKSYNSLLIAKANYLMFKEKNITEAFKLYFDVMEENCKSYQLLNCRPLFWENNNNYSLYERLRKELIQLINYCSSHDDSVLTSYQEYLEKLCIYEKKAKE